MTYRDEHEALRARVAKLEGDLAGAHETVAKLEGRATTERSASAETTEHSRLLDAPKGIALERELPYAISDAGYEAIAAAAQARFGVQVSQVGRTLTAGPFLTITREGDRTRVRVAATWSALEPGPPAGGLLAGAFTGLASFGVLHDLALATPTMMAVHGVWIGVASALGAGWWLRSRAKRAAVANVERYRGMFETALRLAEEHAIEQSTPRVRVADPSERTDPLVDEELAPAETEGESGTGRRSL